MFGLEGSGFIISIGLTFLLTGIIMYFCNTEIAKIKNEISNQNLVIRNLLERFKSSISVDNMNPVANPVAIQSAQNQHVISSNQEIPLIPVSDCDSEEEDDSDEESDEESSDSDSEEVNTGVEEVDVSVEKVDTSAGVNVDSNVNNKSINEETVKIIDLETNTNSPEHFIVEEISADENSKTVQLVESSSDNDDSDDSEQSHKSEQSTDYRQLKVNELKEILINDRNIEPKILKNLKKDELINLLQKK